MSREDDLLARAQRVYAADGDAGKHASKQAGEQDGGQVVEPPPPAVRRQPREQLSTRVRPDLRQRLDAFVDRHGSTVQGVVEAALDEYMSRRGG